MKAKELKKYPLQILVMTITFFITMITPVLFRYLIDDIILDGKYDMLIKWFCVTFTITVVGMIMDFFFVKYNPVKIGIRNSFILQKKSLQNILKMNQTIYSQRDKGYYYNICQNSAGSYGDLHEEIYLNLISNMLYVIGILGFVTYVNRVFGISFVIYGITLVIIVLSSAKPLYKMQRDALQVQDGYLTDMRNVIENKDNINAIHTEHFFCNVFEKSSGKYEKYILKYRFFDYLCRDLSGIINQVCNVLFLFIATFLVMKGKITAGILLMGYQYMGYFAVPITTICSILMRYKANKVHIERIDELEDEAHRERENKAYKKEEEFLLIAKDFYYFKGNKKEDYLYHINDLELRKNGLYVIKGENGSGKSMLFNLMLGNVSIKNSKGVFTVSKDMDCTAFLTYPFFAINGCFEDNLYGIPKDPELLKVLKVDFLEKQISGNPVNLSYGQQQKLALMRVFGTDAPILFLDEPLSNLDVETQQKVIQYIILLKGKKTILVIMHSNELDETADGVITIKDHQMSMEDAGSF